MPLDATLIALDRSVRYYDDFGRLHVAVANISKANICPYRGAEIPEADKLGLDPERVYMLFRDPDELAKAARTFNNVPILIHHEPQTAETHNRDLTIGATGSDAKFVSPFLQNSLVFWDQLAIDGIESGEQKELSAGYKFSADMMPGKHNGEKFDGVMRKLVGNHVALCERGRAGSDVVVGDRLVPMVTRAELETAVAVATRIAASRARRKAMRSHRPLWQTSPKVYAAFALDQAAAENAIKLPMETIERLLAYLRENVNDDVYSMVEDMLVTEIERGEGGADQPGPIPSIPGMAMPGGKLVPSEPRTPLAAQQRPPRLTGDAALRAQIDRERNFYSRFPNAVRLGRI